MWIARLAFRFARRTAEEQIMQALACMSAAARRPLINSVVIGSIPSSATALRASMLHASAPALGGGSPGEWNHVHQWKTKAKLTAMKEAAETAAAKKAKAADEKQGAAAAPKVGGKGGGVAPLPGEKVLVLDETLPDGALEEYFASLRNGGGAGQGGGQKEGGNGAAASTEGTAGGKPRRGLVKKHLLFGWTYKKSNKQQAAAGAPAAAAPAARAGSGGATPQQQKANSQ